MVSFSLFLVEHLSTYDVGVTSAINYIPSLAFHDYILSLTVDVYVLLVFQSTEGRNGTTERRAA